MNREIKFRAYLKESKVIINIENHFKIKAFLDNTYYLDSNTINDSHSIIEDFELLQYTGLKDKNNEDIYEGDIIKYTQHYFNTTMIEIKIKEVKWKYDKWNIYETNAGESHIEIIGNIFENPELLK